MATIPVDSSNVKDRTYYELPPLSKLPSVAVDLMFLGHQSVYDHFLNMWMLQVLTEPIETTDTEAMRRLYRTAFKFEPHIDTLYMLTCFVLWKDYKSPEDCKEILETGLQVNPKSFRIAMTLGYVAHFILKESTYASRYYYLASNIESAPPYVKKVAARLAQKSEIKVEDMDEALKSMLGPFYSKDFVEFLKSKQKAGE